MSKRRRQIKKKSPKAGLPPGSLVLVGDESDAAVKVEVINFDENKVTVTAPKTPEDLRAKDGSLTWLRVIGVHNSKVVREIGEVYSIHPLTLEDVMNTDHLPKTNNFGSYIYIVLKALSEINAGDGEIDSQQINILLGRNYVISFQEKDDGIFDHVLERLKVDAARFFEMGAAYLAYALIDIVVDNYFMSLEKIDEEIYKLEEATASRYDKDTLHLIQALRREVILVRRAAWPLREVVSNLQKRETMLIPESAGVYLSDIYDHVVQVIDTTETFREILSNIFDIYLTGVSNRINEVMKMLTIITTVIMPMTLVTSLYGMNFKFMPELRWRFGYPMALLLMSALGSSMYLYFKRKNFQ